MANPENLIPNKNRTPEELREMFANKCGENGYDDWMKAFCKRKYNSDFSREMTRSVSAALKAFKYQN